MWILGIDIGIKNLGYCLFNGSNLKFGIFNSEELLTNTMIRKWGGTVFARAKIFSDFLSSLFETYEISEVVIEKQVQKNTKAKSIEACLGTIAISHGIKVSIYSPINKFKYLNPVYNSKKKEHKKIVQDYARSILKTYGYSTEYFESFKKKDDISDSMCMSVFTWFIKNKLEDYIVDLLKNKLIMT